MNPDWNYTGDRAAFDFVLARKTSDRRKLQTIFQSLVENPATRPEAHIYDATGRKVSIIHRDGFRIAFWVDHFAKEIRVVDVAFL